MRGLRLRWELSALEAAIEIEDTEMRRRLGIDLRVSKVDRRVYASAVRVEAERRLRVRRAEERR